MVIRSSSAKRSRRSLFVIGGVASLVFTSFFYRPNNTHQFQMKMGVHHDIIDTVPITIVCQLAGEMGNNLGRIGRCLSLKWWLESGAFYNSTDKRYDVRVALRHDDNDKKWVRGANDLQRCFPNTNLFDFTNRYLFDFSEANNQEFEKIWKMQHKMLGGDERVGGTPPFNGINTVDINTVVDKPFPELQSFLSEVSKRHSLVYNTASRRNISLPFLYSTKMQTIDALADRFYQESRQFFHFNESCCTVKADPEETVFHYRNFKKEMPIYWNDYGFHEADPQQAANEVLGHLKEGDKVAIVTRFGGKTTQPYVDAFGARGLKVRVVNGNDGPADFCFLMSAKKEIAGMTLSTFFEWAAYLGNATRVISYQMASSSKKNVLQHNCTSKGLKGKFDFMTLQ